MPLSFVAPAAEAGTSARNRTPDFGFGDRCVTTSTTLICAPETIVLLISGLTLEYRNILNGRFNSDSL